MKDRIVSPNFTMRKRRCIYCIGARSVSSRWRSVIDVGCGCFGDSAFHLPHAFFDLIEFLHRFARGDAHFGELARAGYHLALERTDGLVVVVETAAEVLAEFGQVLGKGAEALIELFAEVADFFRIVREALLAPAIRHRAQ